MEGRKPPPCKACLPSLCVPCRGSGQSLIPRPTAPSSGCPSPQPSGELSCGAEPGMGVINGSGSGTCRDWEVARGFRRSRGELLGSQAENHSEKRGPCSVLGSQAMDPTSQACAQPVGKSRSHRPSLSRRRAARQESALWVGPAGEPPGHTVIPGSLLVCLQGLHCGRHPCPAPPAPA